MPFGEGCSDLREMTSVWQWSAGFIRKQTLFNTGCWTSSGLFLCNFSLLPALHSCLLSVGFWRIWFWRTKKRDGTKDSTGISFLATWTGLTSLTLIGVHKESADRGLEPLFHPAVTRGSDKSLCVMRLIDWETWSRPKCLALWSEKWPCSPCDHLAV